MSGWADFCQGMIQTLCVGDSCPSASLCVSSYVQFLGESNCKSQVIGSQSVLLSHGAVCFHCQGRGEASQHTAMEGTLWSPHCGGLNVVVGSDMGVEQHKVPVPP